MPKEVDVRNLVFVVGIMLSACGGAQVRAHNAAVAAYVALDRLATEFYVAESRRCTKSPNEDLCLVVADSAVDLVNGVYFALRRDDLAAVCAALAGSEAMVARLPKSIQTAVQAVQGATCP
jgi:hypothetical protein